MSDSITILKNPVLTDSANYELLRKKGLDYIEQLGSSLWTDYNIHDPGITLLEMLCYAITDLGYRTSIDIKDLLAEPDGTTPPADPERQGFFTARKILTVNPWTVADYRKLLVDIVGIKNGWLTCKQCPCNDLWLYANCSKSILQYDWTEHPVLIKGLYDILIEFENEPGIGDLNSGKIKFNYIFAGADGLSTALLELRLPSWQQLQNEPEKYAAFSQPCSKIISVNVPFISGNKQDDTDFPDDRKAIELRGIVFAKMVVNYMPDKDIPVVDVLEFLDVPLKIWFTNDGDRSVIDMSALKDAMGDATPSGIMGKYLQLVHRAGKVMKLTHGVLQGHRNLAEDFCSIRAIAVEDIGVCADMDVMPDAEIEAVLAEAYYRIEQYLSPDIKFYSLKELMDEGVPVEEIFEGPELDNGFIDNDQLDSTSLKQFIYASDIINLLMDIPGVIAIRNFTLTKYDADGEQVDNQPWVMPVSFQHQPRLYLEASKILVFKNGLPFLPELNELNDSLQVIRGQNAQPQYSVLENDLPVPVGEFYDLASYFPVQYGLPLTYGVGYHGLPGTATTERKAQALQLKGYLMVFEQLLVNYLAQLANLKEIFAIDTAVTQTYFSNLLEEEDIRQLNELYNGLDAAKLQAMTESESVFLDRRNRFLDHLLARFAENFNSYALMLYSFSNSKAVADVKLIQDKINFLKDFPFMSANRARAINYKELAGVCYNNSNVSGLEVRIRRLLGIEVDALDPVAGKIFVVEHLLLRPRNAPSLPLFPLGDPLLSICIPDDCSLCGEEDPYSFRLTIVLSGEVGISNSGIEFRRFAEETIRNEVPAHLGVKICWVSNAQLLEFETVYCAWLTELAKPTPDAFALHEKLKALLIVFETLKSVYPEARLHDCKDGDDSNRVFLGQTIISSCTDDAETAQ